MAINKHYNLLNQSPIAWNVSIFFVHKRYKKVEAYEQLIINNDDKCIKLVCENQIPTQLTKHNLSFLFYKSKRLVLRYICRLRSLYLVKKIYTMNMVLSGRIKYKTTENINMSLFQTDIGWTKKIYLHENLINIHLFNHIGNLLKLGWYESPQCKVIN